GVKHLQNRDFSEVIAKALSQPPLEENLDGTLSTGFHYKAVLGLADKIVAAVKAGKIKHFFFIGGCDGAKPGRNYFTELAEKVPDDCIILTAACGKDRINARDYGDIDGSNRFVHKDDIIDLGDEPDHIELCRREQQYLLKAIQEDLDLIPHMNSALNSLRIVLAADESVKSGKTVELR
ncbi:hypothetical protein LCGC14_2762110, partial [marine sediment metagenome]